MGEVKICSWEKEDNFDYTYWQSDCGKPFEFTEGGTPAENDFAFCPYCGKVLMVDGSMLVRETGDA